MDTVTVFKSLIRGVTFIASAMISVAATANPTGGTVVNGAASFQNSGNTLTVTNTPGTIINWQQFGIAANEVTRFVQQSASSAVLNRVTGGDVSAILGQLQSNGRVFLVNPNGFIFGQNAVIDTAGLIASTLNLSNQDFLANRLKFEDLANNAEILNQGFIHTSNDGEVVLVAPNVKNEGVIDVEQGKLVLAAGQSVTISSLNYDNIEFEVQAPDNEVVNLGELVSDGGSIGVFASSIRNAGTVSANAVTVDDAGNIVFTASDAISLEQNSHVTATSNAGAGGNVSISARSADSDNSAVLVQNGDIVVDGETGGAVEINVDNLITSGYTSAQGYNNAGSIDIRTDNIRATVHTEFNVDSVAAEGGRISQYADESVLTSASYSATGNTGGSVHILSSGAVSLAGASIMADGLYGGGNIRVGGGIQGGEGLVSAQHTRVNANTVLSARASLHGDGGTVAVWSDTYTGFLGSIDVRAGDLSGDGGFAEVSSKGAFQYAGTVHRDAPNGEAGVLLLDPVDITIAANAGGGLSTLELQDLNRGDFEAFGGGLAGPFGFIVDNNFSFTAPTITLTNGNIVVTDPNDFGGTGAAYMFADNGLLITTLIGGNSLDEVGGGGATQVGLGVNVVINSPRWNGDAGAWTFIDGNTGEVGGAGGPTSHVLSLGNPLSLTGTVPGDGAGAFTTQLFNQNGDYVVSTPNWSDGNISNVGAVTHVNGLTGVITGGGSASGTINVNNSITGRNAGDQIGKFITTGQGGLGHFITSSSSYTNDQGNANAGIAFMVDGSNGQFISGATGYGQVSDSRGLFGLNANDFVSSGGVYRVGSLFNTGFVVASPNVNAGRGAATFIAGAPGSEGLIGPSQATSTSPDNTNSLTGVNPGDRVSSGGVIQLESINSDKYLVVSEDWNGTLGAVTLGLGATAGDVTNANSITGQAANDAIGDIAVPLANGNFAVGSQFWTDNGGVARGAVAIGDGATGRILATNSFGPITNTNSLFGANDNENIGGNPGFVVPLDNGNVVVVSADWNNGAGAVTLINGATGIISNTGSFAGSPTTANSITGGTPNDFIGTSNTTYGPGIADIGNGNFAIVSGSWQLTGLPVGAITLADGNTGAFVIGSGFGVVDASNSITGSTTGDLIDAVAVPLGNGHFIVAAPLWDDFTQGIIDVGAVAHINGSDSAIGGNAFTPGSTVISPTNALIGSRQNDHISGTQVDGFEIFLFILDNGDYVIGSPDFDNGALVDAGAITIGDGTNGSTGILDASNSVLGDSSGDRYGSGRFVPHFDNSGRFVSLNPDADSNGFTDNGNVFLIDPNQAVTDINFNDNAGSSLNISAQGLANALAGGDVVLQASNDIIQQAGADVLVNANGNGSMLTLQAGRSILLNADIITDNGKLVLIANDPGALANDRAAGNALIQQADGTAINTGTANLEITMSNGVDSGAATSGDDIVLATVDAAHMIVRQKTSTSSSDILRTATGSIRAASFFIDHEFSNDGTIGTGTQPLRVFTDDIGAHIHGSIGSPSLGIFMDVEHNGSGTVTVGDTCYGRGDVALGCNTFGAHIIRGIQTELGGSIQINFNNSAAQIFAVADGNQYGINGSDAFLNLSVNAGAFSSDADIINTAGDLTIFASGNVSLTNTANVNPQISSFGDITITTGANSGFTMDAGTTITGMGSPGLEIGIDAGTNISLQDINAPGYTVRLDNVALPGSGVISNNPDTFIVADNLDITADDDVILRTTTQFLTAFGEFNGSGSTFSITNTGSTLDITSIDMGILSNQGNVSISNDQAITISGSVTVVDGNIDITSNAAITLLADVSQNSGGAQLSLKSDANVSVQSNITAAGTLTIEADADNDNVGFASITSAFGSSILVSSIGDMVITGENVSISGGGSGTANESVNIQSIAGSVTLTAKNSNISIQGGAANNTSVNISGTSFTGSDIIMNAPFSINLTAGSGGNSSVAIRGLATTPQDAVVLTANALQFDNANAGTDSDVYIEAAGGAANVNISAVNTCNGCIGIDNPANIAGSQAGIWALNFPAGGGSLFTWLGTTNTDWATGSNWDLGTVPTSADDVVIGLFTVDINSPESVNNLTVNGGTLQLGSIGSLTLGGTATLDSSSTLTLNGGSLTANGTFNSAGTVNINAGSTATFNQVASFNALNVSGATAVLNGLNNTINAFSLASFATLQGTGNTDVNGAFNWSESTVSHTLNANGAVTIPFITNGATVNGGVVTLTGSSSTTVSQQIDITATGQLVNQGAMAIVDGQGSIVSTDGNGTFNNQSGSITFNGGTGGTVSIGNNTGLTFITTGVLNADVGTINLNPTNPVQWNGGTWTGAGGNVSFNTTLDIGGNAIKTLDGFTLNAFNDVNFTGDGDLDIINGGNFAISLGPVVTHASNAGILSSDGTGLFTSSQGVFTKTAGTTNVTAAYSVSQTDITGGTLILAEAGNPLDNTSYNFTGGTLQINSDRVFGLGGYNFTAGTFRVDNAANVVINPNTGASSTFNNLILAGGATISGNDSILVNGTFDWLAGSIINALTIGNTGVMNLSDSLAIPGSFINNGQTNILSGGLLLLNAGNTHSGTFNVASGATLDIDTGTHIFNGAISGGGTLSISNSTSDLVLNADSSIGALQMSVGILQGSGNLNVTNLSSWNSGILGGSGVTTFSGGVDISNFVTLDRVVNTNGGSIDNNATVVDGGSGTAAFNLVGGVFTVGTTGTQVLDTGVTVNNGAILDVQGVLDVTAATAAGVTNNGGTINGIGNIIGNVTNNGVIAPGNSIGTLTITGDLLLQQNSIIAIEVAGADVQAPGDQAGAQYDQLIVTGSTTLDGELQVQVAQDANLNLQDTLLPVTSAAVAPGSSFARVAPSPGYQFDLNGLELVTLSVPDQVIIDPVGSDIITLTRAVEDIDSLIDSLDYLVTPDTADEDDRESATLVCS